MYPCLNIFITLNARGFIYPHFGKLIWSITKESKSCSTSKVRTIFTDRWSFHFQIVITSPWLYDYVNVLYLFWKYFLNKGNGGQQTFHGIADITRWICFIYFICFTWIGCNLYSCVLYSFLLHWKLFARFANCLKIDSSACYAAEVCVCGAMVSKVSHFFVYSYTVFFSRIPIIHRNCNVKGGGHLYFSVPLPPAHEHLPFPFNLKHELWWEAAIRRFTEEKLFWKFREFHS